MPRTSRFGIRDVYSEPGPTVTTSEAASAQRRQLDLQSELQRLTDAVAPEDHSDSLLAVVREREAELRHIKRGLLYQTRNSAEAEVEEMRNFVTERLGNIHQLLQSEVTTARAELGKHVTEICMTLQQDGTQGFYLARARGIC